MRDAGALVRGTAAKTSRPRTCPAPTSPSATDAIVWLRPRSTNSGTTTTAEAYNPRAARVIAVCSDRNRAERVTCRTGVAAGHVRWSGQAGVSSSQCTGRLTSRKTAA